MSEHGDTHRALMERLVILRPDETFLTRSAIGPYSASWFELVNNSIESEPEHEPEPGRTPDSKSPAPNLSAAALVRDARDDKRTATGERRVAKDRRRIAEDEKRLEAFDELLIPSENHRWVGPVDRTHYGSDAELHGCEADARAMRAIAASRGFQASAVLLSREATREAVIEGIPDDPEENGRDETWCPHDAQLIDDELYALRREFPAGSRILVVSDSCHGQSVARAAANGRTVPIASPGEVAEAQGAMPCWMPARFSAGIHNARRAFYDGLFAAVARPARATALPPSVQVLSGCQDNQLSMDGPTNGALTTRLLEVWADGAYRGSTEICCRDIRRLMPESRSPRYTRYGAEHAAFPAQPPCTP